MGFNASLRYGKHEVRSNQELYFIYTSYGRPTSRVSTLSSGTKLLIYCRKQYARLALRAWSRRLVEIIQYAATCFRWGVVEDSELLSAIRLLICSITSSQDGTKRIYDPVYIDETGYNLFTTRTVGHSRMGNWP